MIKKAENKKGIITLEACITVLFFIMLMLLILGLYRMFMVQNTTAHAAFETAESLSLNAYSAEKLGNGDWDSVGDLINGLFGMFSNSDYSTYDNWYDSDENAGDANLADTVKTRFVAYLSGGDEDAADLFLESLNVADGLEGLDFSGSYIDSGILYVQVKYDLQYDFKIGPLDTVSVEQTACAKLWK